MLGLDALVEAPALVLLVAVVGATLVASLVGLLLVRRNVPHTVLREHNDVAGFIFAAQGVVYAVLLAQVVIAVWETYDTGRRRVSEEAAYVVSLHRTGDALPAPMGPDLQAAVVDYARSVVEDEWPLLARGGESARSAGALDAIWGALRADGVAGGASAWHEVAIASVEALTRLREERIFEARERIPGVLVLLLVLGGGITVGYTFLYGVRNLRGHALMTAALTASIALILGVIVLLDAPYRGAVGIEPSPFLEALADVGAEPRG